MSWSRDTCGGAMRILAVLPDGDAILHHLGLPTEPPGEIVGDPAHLGAP